MGCGLNQPQWNDPGARVLAFTIAGIDGDEADIHAVLNMSDQVIDAEIAAVPGRRWHLAVNTAAASPDDVIERAHQPAVTTTFCPVGPRSVVVLEGHAVA